MNKSEIAFITIVISAVAALLVNEYYFNHVEMGRLVFPLTAGGLVVGLGLIRIARLLLRPSLETGEKVESNRGRAQYSAIASCLAIFPLIWAGGFFGGTAIYIAIVMKMGGASLWLALVTAAVMTAAFYLLFMKLFQVLLPVAPLWMY